MNRANLDDSDDLMANVIDSDDLMANLYIKNYVYKSPKIIIFQIFKNPRQNFTDYLEPRPCFERQ